MLDPDPHGFGTFAWIQIRIRTFSYIYIHESLKNSCGHYISFDWVCYTVFCRNPDSIATVLFIVCFGVLMFSFFIEDEKTNVFYPYTYSMPPSVKFKFIGSESYEKVKVGSRFRSKILPRSGSGFCLKLKIANDKNFKLDL